MVHGGHKFLNDEASYDGRQITLALHFAGEDFNVMVWKEESISEREPPPSASHQHWPPNALLGPVQPDLAANQYSAKAATPQSSSLASLTPTGSLWW